VRRVGAGLKPASTEFPFLSVGVTASRGAIRAGGKK
jgi:hypothetical protein